MSNIFELKDDGKYKRDYQKQKLYDFENKYIMPLIVQNEYSLSRDNLEDIIYALMWEYGQKGVVVSVTCYPLPLLDGICEVNRVHKFVSMNFSPRGRKFGVAIHETAHALTSMKQHGHSPLFIATYFDMLEHHCGLDYNILLKLSQGFIDAKGRYVSLKVAPRSQVLPRVYVSKYLEKHWAA